MTPDEALIAARVAATRRKLIFTYHVEVERMPRRGLQRADVRSALMTATSAAPDPPPDTKFKFFGGHDVDGDAVDKVVGEFVGEHLRIVTAM